MLRKVRRRYDRVPARAPQAAILGGRRPLKVRERRLERLRVPQPELRWRCDPGLLPFRTTAELEPARGIIGQDKAMRALTLGIGMRSPGYNVFVCGAPGTGRLTAVRAALARYRRADYQPVDLCYVPNLEIPERPRLLAFPAGTGCRFHDDVNRLLVRLHRQVGGRGSAAARRNRLRSLLTDCLPRLLRRHPVEGADRYLGQIARAVMEREDRWTPAELGVNLFSQALRRSPPVVLPATVSHGTLFGAVSGGAEENAPPPHCRLRAGAVVEASGGVLVLEAAPLLASPPLWSTFKSCLEHGRLELHDVEPSSGHLRSGLRPDPIPCDLKVVLVGDYCAYDDLAAADPDFVNLFKVRVDFDSEVDVTRTVVTRHYPAFITGVIRREGLLNFSGEAVAGVIEFAVRRAGRKNKITTQFSTVADLVREASFWARREGRRLVQARHVERALSEILDRLNLVETKISEMIEEGTILIDTGGSRVGQVNGLAMYDQGDYAFGKPSRITAETSVGQGGIINIERESGFSGSSHDKGVQILGGYLRSRFAQRRPLSLTASVCFEQSYAAVDGDSASSSEIFAILSSLSGLPIRQDLAVTGSMNQKGDIQPIGGVNEKIEGFFDCVAAGRPTGREGVIIPRRNIPDLMLREDVVEAVRGRRFHIYAIRTVEEGIEILTGIRAGRLRRNGSYARDTVFGRADRRLDEMAAGLRRAQGDG